MCLVVGTPPKTLGKWGLYRAAAGQKLNYRRQLYLRLPQLSSNITKLGKELIW